MWRVWIEISMLCLVAAMLVSPSVWRVWIEIGQQQSLTGSKLSPSVWRVWIEIYTATYINPRRRSHPPCGGCGLKFSGRLFALLEYVSPSVWRVWIEILAGLHSVASAPSPSVWRVWIEIEVAKTIADRVNVTLRVEGVD